MLTELDDELGLRQGGLDGSGRSIRRCYRVNNLDFLGSTLDSDEFQGADYPNGIDGLAGMSEGLTMDCEGGEPPEQYVLELIPSVAVDVSVSNSNDGLDPTKHSTVMFKLDLPLPIDRPSIDDEVAGADESVEVSKARKGKKTNTHKYKSFAGGSKITKSIKMGQGDGNKFKAGNNQRILLKKSMANLAKAISTPISTVAGVILIPSTEDHKVASEVFEQ